MVDVGTVDKTFEQANWDRQTGGRAGGRADGQTQVLGGLRLQKFEMKEMYEVFHMSYLNGGQCKTDKDVMVLGHMAIIPFPVLWKCRKLLKRAKTTKIKYKDN